jgi:hypothetical protein
MQDEYPADDGVRPRLVCDAAQTESASGRLFLCASCRDQVIICGCCDRGQIYCNHGCAWRARRQTVVAAGQRYQKTARGGRMHAARQGRYRARQERVTHHGSPPPAADGLLPPDAMTTTPDDVSSADGPWPPVLHCHWCGRGCLTLLRQGFLRRRRRRRVRVGHDPTGHARHGNAA